MSVDVHRYLDNSGGSNFTENTPRPPVGPGEENEQQSTGGHSNKSSGSHKSLNSNRSNSSGAGGATPRKVQKPAKLPPTAAAVSQPPATAQHAGEHEAPLGFEPEGSVDGKLEFTESGSPIYAKWSEDLDYLLDDAEGVNLFKKYLTEENNVNLFEFYFAWKYLQALDSEAVKDIGYLVKTMNRVYIKGDKKDKKLTMIAKESEESIASQVASKQYSKSIFDPVKDQVLEILRREFYLPFFKSNIYLQYIQSLEESPKDSVNSSGSTSARPLSTALPTVHEDSELDLHPVSSNIDNFTSDAPVLSLTAKNMKMTERLRQESKIKPEDQAGYYLQKASRDDCALPPHPYHTYNTSYLPISAIDSERQSLSSEALTDDTHSITDSSVDGYPQYTNRRSVRNYYRKIKSSAQRNLEAHSSVSCNIVPPKNRLSKVSNVAETSPMEFAKLLTEKLQRVLDEQNHNEIMRSKLSAMSEDDATTDDSHSVLSSTTGGGTGTTNATLNQLLVTIQTNDHFDEAQHILDMHCKRIWEPSGQHTPAKSPSRAKSPDPLHSMYASQAKRMHTMQKPSVTHAALPLQYNKPSTITPSTKPLSNPALLQYSSTDNSYPFATAPNLPYSNKSNSRHGMATFSSRAEQQSIFKFPPGVSANNQKVAEWISKNEEIMHHANLHGQPDSEKSSQKKSQRSGSTSASPRVAVRSKVYGKGSALSSDSKRLPSDDKHSYKSNSKSSGSSSRERRAMSRSAGDSTTPTLSSQQTLTQRKGVPAPPQIKVAFFLLDEPIPYSVTVPVNQITLAKFKELITKKGNYRYFFKKATDDEFGTVLEEVTNDNHILPKWESKVVGYVKKVE